MLQSFINSLGVHRRSECSNLGKARVLRLLWGVIGIMRYVLHCSSIDLSVILILVDFKEVKVCRYRNHPSAEDISSRVGFGI